MSDEIGSYVIFVVVFVGLFALLIGNMPVSLLLSAEERAGYYGYAIPKGFSTQELSGVTNFQQYNVTYSALYPVAQEYEFNDTVTFRAWFTYFYDPEPGSGVAFQHLYYLGPFPFWDSMRINVPNEYVIYKENLMAHMNNATHHAVFQVSCDHDSAATVWISDSNYTRAEPWTAWDEGKITIGMGFGYSQNMIKLSGWSIMGALLTFQLPTVIGLSGIAGTILSAAITLPLMAMTAYVIFRVIMWIKEL